MLSSLVTKENIFNSTEELMEWIKDRNNKIHVEVDPIPFKQMSNWYMDTDGVLRSCTGKFFSIEGIHVETDFPYQHEWDQPIINQPEIGYLGIIAKEFEGVLYFLMQAKIEPGNVNCVQISPTLQATKSNYTCMHKGKKPRYLEFFQNATADQVILDQLQSEQGARFLRKRNRNIIIKIDSDIEVHEDFRWFTLAQIKQLINHNNLVNMDTRTVISGINIAELEDNDNLLNYFSSFGKKLYFSAKEKNGINSLNNILSWLTSLKARYDLFVKYKPMKELQDWKIKDSEISREDGKYFKIIGVNVSIQNREVSSWCQPLVQPTQQGLCVFLIKEIDGIIHFLVQAKLECGNHDIMEFAPTIQCLTGDVYKSEIKPFFVDYVFENKGTVIYDALQSEEGGRFYHEQNRNMIIDISDEPNFELPENYIWMTLGQLYEFLKYNNFLNIQARSLISALQFI